MGYLEHLIEVKLASRYTVLAELPTISRPLYDPIRDCEVNDCLSSIQHGRFYTESSYPDQEVFSTVGMLALRYNPDYLLVHPMGMDHVGHIYGSDSSQYRNQAISQDFLIANFVPE